MFESDVKYGIKTKSCDDVTAFLLNILKCISKDTFNLINNLEY